MSRFRDALSAASGVLTLAQGAMSWRDRRGTPERNRATAIRKATRLRRLAVRREGRVFRSKRIRTSEQLREEAAILDAEAEVWAAMIRG